MSKQFIAIVLCVLPISIYGISWSSISPNRVDKIIYKGEYIHFRWESSPLDRCQDITITLMDLNTTINSVSCERQAGFCKKIWPCVIEGTYQFKIECDIYSNISSSYIIKSVHSTTLLKSMYFYKMTDNIFTWQENLAVVVNKNISLFSYPNMELLKTKIVSTDDLNIEENTRFQYNIENGKSYKFQVYDYCNAMIGESDVFSVLFPLEQGATLAPSPTPSQSPTPTQSTPNPTTSSPTVQTPETSEPTYIESSATALSNVLTTFFLIFIWI